MSMVSNGNRNRGTFWRAFAHAYAGILTAVKAERNMRFHLVSSCLVLILSFCFSITKIEWLFVLISIGGMVALEIINSAIERVVDLVTSEFHPLAKQAKDLAAGAVFVYAILSIIIGIIIFLPYFIKLFTV